MAPVSHEAVVDIFGARFDTWSARAVFEELLSEAGVSQAASYSPADLLKVAERLELSRRSQTEYVLFQLREVAGPAPAAKAPAPKSEPAPAKAAPAKSEAKPERGQIDAPRPQAAGKVAAAAKRRPRKAGDEQDEG